MSAISILSTSNTTPATTSDSSNYSTHLTLDAGDFSEGKYLILGSFNVHGTGGAGTWRECDSRVRQGTTDIWGTWRNRCQNGGSSSTRGPTYQFMCEVDQGASPQDVTFQYKTSGGEISMNLAWMTAIRVEELEAAGDYVFGEDTTAEQDLSTTYASFANTGSIGAADDNWLVLGHCIFEHSNTTEVSCQGRVTDGSTPAGALEITSYSNVGARNLPVLVPFHVYTISGATTFSVQAAEESSHDNQIDYSCIAAIRLDAFENWGYSNTDTNKNAKGWVELEGITPTVDTTGTGFVLGYYCQDAANEFVYTEPRIQETGSSIGLISAAGIYTYQRSTPDGVPIVDAAVQSFTAGTLDLDLDAHEDGENTNCTTINRRILYFSAELAAAAGANLLAAVYHQRYHNLAL